MTPFTKKAACNDFGGELLRAGHPRFDCFDKIHGAIASMVSVNPFSRSLLKRSGFVDDARLAGRLRRKIEHANGYTPKGIDTPLNKIFSRTLYVSLPPTSLRKTNVVAAIAQVRSEFPSWTIIAKEVDFASQP
jgi:hypothetical protein